MPATPEISIVTPCLNDLAYLRRACASVADQKGIPLEHIVVDGGSVDGSLDWLQSRPGILTVTGRDGSMYEALNRGLERATGRWVAFLNCDEQFLPGALETILHAAEASPDTKVFTGDFLVIRADGSLICHRKEIAPRSLYIRSSYLYTFTCATFFRRDLAGSLLRFDQSFRAAGDEELLLRILKEVRPRHVRRYLSAFTDRRNALGMSADAVEETRRLRRLDPVWFRPLRPLLRAARHLEKGIAGGYRSAPSLVYHVYAGGNEESRTTFSVRQAGWRWNRR